VSGAVGSTKAREETWHNRLGFQRDGTDRCGGGQIRSGECLREDKRRGFGVLWMVGVKRAVER
jgi:hypothetical protein